MVVSDTRAEDNGGPEKMDVKSGTKVSETGAEETLDSNRLELKEGRT